MKKISPKELTDLLNQDGGIPEGEEVHFSALIRGFNDSLEDFRNTFLEYNGHAELFSRGNREYIFRYHDFAFLFTQVDNAKINIGHNKYSEIFIPIKDQPRHIGIYRPEQIKF